MHALEHPEQLLLDGLWDFELLDSPEAEPTGQWRQIRVPGAWTMQGTADLPQYTNIQMPFPQSPPEVPARNPTGRYRKNFTVRKPGADNASCCMSEPRKACSWSA